MESEYLTYIEVGARLRVGRLTVMRLVKAGKLPVVYVSPRRPRILRADLDAYEASQRRTLTPEAKDEQAL